MTATETPASAENELEPSASKQDRTVTGAWIAIGVMLAALLAAAVAGAALNRTSDPPQLTAMHEGCAGWTGTMAGSSMGPNADWCGQMDGWMRQQLETGRMSGPMMWSSPAAMRDTCRQYMTTGQPTTTTGSASAPDPAAWCDQMIDWMTQHMGGWNNGMMNGPRNGMGMSAR